MSVLLPGDGTQSLDRISVGDCGLRGRFARVVVPAVEWAT